jgi:hypothetical protein
LFAEAHYCLFVPLLSLVASLSRNRFRGIVFGPEESVCETFIGIKMPADAACNLCVKGKSVQMELLRIFIYYLWEQKIHFCFSVKVNYDLVYMHDFISGGLLHTSRQVKVRQINKHLDYLLLNSMI